MNIDARGRRILSAGNGPHGPAPEYANWLLYPPARRGVGAAVTRPTRSRNMPVEAAIVRHFRQRECSVEETLLEIYQAGISMRRAVAIAQKLWGARVHAATLSELSQRVAARITLWRERPLRGRHPYVYLGAVALRRRWGGETQDVNVLAAVGVNEHGFREVLGVVDGTDRGDGVWPGFMQELSARGLSGVRLVIGAMDSEVTEAVAQTYPAAACQGCLWQLQREVLGLVAVAQIPKVSGLFEAITDSATGAEAQAKAQWALAQLRRLRQPEAARKFEHALGAMAGYFAFPRAHWASLRSNFALTKILRQIRERTRLVGAFSDEESAVLLVSARLRCIADQWSASRRYLDMRSLVGENGAQDADDVASERTAHLAQR